MNPAVKSWKPAMSQNMESAPSVLDLAVACTWWTWVESKSKEKRKSEPKSLTFSGGFPPCFGEFLPINAVFQNIIFVMTELYFSFL
jgi:hypothetical protein